jgi:hypothetical protein
VVLFVVLFQPYLQLRLQTEGNLVSELGFGPWRKANEDFLATFERSYQVTPAAV